MNQHYVPRVYLKNFAEKRGKEFYINVLDTSSGEFIKPNIKGICAEKDFYTLNEDSKHTTADLKAIETIYSDFIEPMYQQAYEILTNDNIININFTDRANIIIGVMQLYSRNPAILVQEWNYIEKKLLKYMKRTNLKELRD